MTLSAGATALRVLGAASPEGAMLTYRESVPISTMDGLVLQFLRTSEARCPCRELGIHLETGDFGARMDVELVNDDPVTIVV